MKEPFILARPGYMRDRRNTPLSLWEGSPVSIIQGQYGDAWQMSEETSVIDFEPMFIEQEFTLFFRVRMEAVNTGGSFNLAPDWNHEQWAYIGFEASAPSPLFFLSDVQDWVDVVGIQTQSTDVWRTMAIVVKQDSARVFENGVELSAEVYTPPFSIIGDVRQLLLPRHHALESFLMFDSALTENEVRYVSRLQEPWTWNNVQIKQPSSLVVQAVESGGVVPSISGYRLIPKLYKADRHNVLGEDITEHVMRGVVEYNPDRTIKMTFTADMDAKASLTPFTDFLAPFVTMQYDDGTEVTSQMGLYTFVPPKQTINQQHRTATLDGRDLTWILSTAVFDQGYSVAAGTNVITAVQDVLIGAGFTRFAIQQSSRTLTSARSWTAGTTKLEVINDLLNSIGYYTLYCLKDGRFASMPYRSVINPTISVEYDTTKGSYVQIVGQVMLDTTPDRIANKIVVVRENANEAPLVAIAKNTNPNSPTSIQNIGYEITKRYTNSNAVDQAALNDLAKEALADASQQYNKVSIQTFPDVLREPTNEVYRLNIVDSDNEVVLDGVWRCRGWRLDFDNRRMTHELSNVDEPPFDISGGL